MSRFARSIIGLIALTTIPLGVASAAVPTVYHSPNDDGVPAVAPAEVLPGAGGSVALHLYIDGGPVGSTQGLCSTGTGDEICAYDLSLAATGGLSLSNFTPAPNVDFHLAPTTLGIVGVDPWRGALGPIKIGDVDVQGPTAATLVLMPSQSVNASMGIDLIPQATIVTVPEPGALSALVPGALLLLVLYVQRRKQRVSGIALLVLGASLSLTATLPAQAQAQVSTDCGDVISNGVIDIADLDALRRFLVGDPGAPDLQGDPQGLARCDVGGNGLCEIDDYARISRYMLDLQGGLNETCPLAGTAFAPVVLPPPTVDPASPVSTDRASVILSGTATPGDVVGVTGAWGQPATITGIDGTWQIEVPLVFDAANVMSVFVDYGTGHLSPAVPHTVTQTDSTGASSVDGRAVDAADGSPLPGVTVTAGGTTTTTDEFGRFAIFDLPEGRVVIRAGHPDFVPEVFTRYTDEGLFITEGTFVSPIPEWFGMARRAPAVTVGAGGGTVFSAAGVELIVPPGALSGDTQISLTDHASPRNRFSRGIPVVDIGPGPITFDPPAILRIPASLPPGATIDLVRVEQATGVETPTLGTVNGQGAIEVEVDSTNGDDYQVKHFPGVPQDPSGSTYHKPHTETYDNCDGSNPSINGYQKNLNVTFEWNPLLKLLNYNPLSVMEKYLVFKDIVDDGKMLHFKPENAPTIFQPIPPGFSITVNVNREHLPIKQKIQVLRTSPICPTCTKNLGEWGELRYDVTRVTSIDVVLVNDKPCLRRKAAGYADPHMIRFDHAGEAIFGSRGAGRYDFQATGEFVLFESTEDDMVVQARLEPSNNSTSVGTAAAMDVDGDRVSVYGGQAVLDVRIEGIPTPLTVGVPVPLPGGGELERGTTSFGTDSLTVRWADGSEFLARAWHSQFFVSFFPTLAPGRFARVQGLLGNANGIMVDDLNLRDGTPSDVAELYTTYADSWRIAAAESLFDYEPGEDTSTYNGTPADPDYTVDDLDPVTRAAAEAECIAAGIVDDPIFTDCVIDVAVLGNDATDAASDALALVPNEGSYVAVPGDANIFAAGLASVPDLGGGGGDGSLPVEITLPAGTDRQLRVLDAAGTISVSATETLIPPDGLASSPIEWGTWGGLAGPNVSRKGITLGVFLEATSPPATTPGPYACGDASGQFVRPEIGQVFCLGDGLSAFDEPQFVTIPDTATRLFLGHADRLFLPSLDLADIVGGGDGTGTGSLQAINIFNGGTESSHAGALSAPTNSFVPSANAFVDGVVVPDGGSGPVPISSTGLSVTGISDSTGNNGQSITHAWDHIWNGHANGITSTLTGSILGVATNKGITFDLDAIEVAYPGAEVVAAPLTAAMGSTTQATSATDYYVFVDGVLSGVTSISGAIAGPDTARNLSLTSISSDSRFLTLITSSAGWTNSDWAFWLDATLELGTDGVPPGHYGDNSGAHEFILLISP